MLFYLAKRELCAYIKPMSSGWRGSQQGVRAMAKSLYVVSSKNKDGQHGLSQTFETLRACRNHLKWLETRSWVAEAYILKGGAGGERVS